jgi:hypothetical protein
MLEGPTLRSPCDSFGTERFKPHTFQVKWQTWGKSEHVFFWVFVWSERDNHYTTETNSSGSLWLKKYLITLLCPRSPRRHSKCSMEYNCQRFKQSYHGLCQNFKPSFFFPELSWKLSLIILGLCFIHILTLKYNFKNAEDRTISSPFFHWITKLSFNTRENVYSKAACGVGQGPGLSHSHLSKSCVKGAQLTKWPEQTIAFIGIFNAFPLHSAAGSAVSRLGLSPSTSCPRLLSALRVGCA